MGKDVEKEHVEPVELGHDARAEPQALRVLEEHERHEHPGDAEGDGLRGDPRVVAEHLQAEDRFARLAVVADEIFFGIAAQVVVGADRCEHVGVRRDPHGVERRDGDKGHGDRDRQIADAVQRRRHLSRRIAGQLGKRLGGRAREAQSRSREQHAQGRGLRDLTGARRDGRELRGPRLVVLDELIGVRARETALARQRAQPIPFGGVG